MNPISWTIRGQTVALPRRPLVMGIVNATPDSFSDGGQFLDAGNATRHALRLLEEGADILDIGGESTRPGSQPVSLDEELGRVLPVVRNLVTSGIGAALLSIDTAKAEVAFRCLEAGAHIINDVTALRGDAEMGRVVRDFAAGIVLMHMQGTPATMQIEPVYEDPVRDILRFFEERLQACAVLGIASSCIAVDPGIGFGKTADHNLSLLARLDEFKVLGRPLCLGVSRKAFFGRLLGRGKEERLAGSLAVALDAAMNGNAHVLRVHDVAPTCDALRVVATLADRREKRS